MGASLLGLLFTVVATLNCKSASRKMEVGMNDYFDFLRRELMPTLATSMSSSPCSSKPSSTASPTSPATTTPKPPRNLNENLVLQQRMLEAVSGMNMTKTANRLALAMKDMDTAAETFAAVHRKPARAQRYYRAQRRCRRAHGCSPTASRASSTPCVPWPTPSTRRRPCTTPSDAPSKSTSLPAPRAARCGGSSSKPSLPTRRRPHAVSISSSPPTRPMWKILWPTTAVSSPPSTSSGPSYSR